MTVAALRAWWLKAFLFALLGYILLGRGFAYLFIGEFLLLLGGILLIASRRALIVFSEPVLFLWLLLTLWGICRTTPYVSLYGFDCVRDAMVFGYGLFAVLLVAFVDRAEMVWKAFGVYRKFLRFWLVVCPAIIGVTITKHPGWLHIPWAKGPDVVLVQAKAGDAAVHLTTAALFLLMLSKYYSSEKVRQVTVIGVVQFLGWFAAFALVVITSRGGLCGLIAAVGLASLLRMEAVGFKAMTMATAVSVAGILLLLVFPFSIRLKGSEVTPEAAVHLVTSIASGDDAQGHRGTKEFRLIWWGRIVRDVALGPYRWTGRGFGINLATAYGPPNVDKTLRSPHNGSMTILARMGVPGLLIWIALNVTHVYRMSIAYLRAVRARMELWAIVDLIVLCYWVVSFINMSFDVYLEGPQGGVWFWSMIGIGTAVVRIQGRELRAQQQQRVVAMPQDENKTRRLRRPLAAAV